MFHRLEASVSHLRGQLEENADLNKTLKRELHIYDNFTPKQGQGMCNMLTDNKYGHYKILLQCLILCLLIILLLFVNHL